MLVTSNGYRWSLDGARREAGLSMDDLWVRYIGLSGSASAMMMSAFVAGAVPPTRRDHDLVAQALNERFLDLGRDMPVRYFHELDMKD